MMSTFEVRPTNELIRKGLKQRSMRGSHKGGQRCKLSNCSLADITRQTVSFMLACPLWVISGHSRNSLRNKASVSRAVSRRAIEMIALPPGAGIKVSMSQFFVAAIE